MPSSQVFHEWKRGKLRSGSKRGPVVRNRKQAIAIYLSEKRREQQGRTLKRKKRARKSHSRR